ncbi:hypothetical protein Ciccas_003381 [Cichlidogyrus casuarinus]|uniref:BHLH domain-containing protein n=1 Tax=Cichlidogyrus casuarinus TaxID=1844966 RepID=A0ABD2QEI8_9PLAT
MYYQDPADPTRLLLVDQTQSQWTGPFQQQTSLPLTMPTPMMPLHILTPGNVPYGGFFIPVSYANTAPYVNRSKSMPRRTQNGLMFPRSPLLMHNRQASSQNSCSYPLDQQELKHPDFMRSRPRQMHSRMCQSFTQDYNPAPQNTRPNQSNYSSFLDNPQRASAETLLLAYLNQMNLSPTDQSSPRFMPNAAIATSDTQDTIFNASMSPPNNSSFFYQQPSMSPALPKKRMTTSESDCAQAQNSSSGFELLSVSREIIPPKVKVEEPVSVPPPASILKNRRRSRRMSEQRKKIAINDPRSCSRFRVIRVKDTQSRWLATGIDRPLTCLDVKLSNLPDCIKQLHRITSEKKKASAYERQFTHN